MSQPFSLSGPRCQEITDPSLRQEIDRHTENSNATDRIIRSIGRFGSDASILRFDMTPMPPGRATRFDSPAGWTVRAVRLETPPQAAPTDGTL